MAILVVEGFVPDTFNHQGQFYLKLDKDNERKALKFYDENGITTKFRPGGISIAKNGIVRNCEGGDYIQVNFESTVRSNGVGIRAVDFKKIR